jgi:hypothetical protein
MRLVARLSALCAAAGSVAWAVWACLPDLSPLPPAAPKAYCGDGVIDWLKEGGIGEQCDPGEAGARGCTSVCSVDCPSGGFLDPKTGHCYFLRDAKPSFKDAKSLCEAEGAHIVTFSSDLEYEALHDWYVKATGVGDSYFWIGLEGDVSDRVYNSSNPDEPGFGVPARACPGCFGRLPQNSDYFSAPDGSPPDRQLGCVAGVRVSKSLPWYQVLCANNRIGNNPNPISGATVCEREPAGARARSCDGGQCIDLASTLSSKKYLFKSERAVASAAAAFCRTLPQGSLVMLDTREEREQLGREIGRLTPRDGQPPSTFWIGLSTTNGSDWQWDDGSAASSRPPVWGDKEPRSASGAARAYIQIFATSYDTTLAHVDADPNSTRPYVCQYK